MDEFGLGPIFASVDKVINTTAAVADTAPESRERALLEAVLTRLRAIRAEAPELLGVHLGNLKTRAEAVRAEAARLTPEFDAARARLDQVKADAERTRQKALAGLGRLPPEPPDLPLPPLDFDLGTSLRSELLGRYATGAAAAAPFDPGQDIWEDWK